MAKISSIQPQNIVLLGGLALCSLITFLGFSVIDRLEKLGQARQEEQYLERLELVSNDVRARLDSLSIITLIKAEHLASSNQTCSSIGETDSELEKLKQLLPTLRTMIIVNAQGIVVDDMRDNKPAVDIDVSDREYFQVHVQEQTNDLRVFSPVVSRVDGKWTWVLSAPVRASSGELLAVVVTSFDRQFFNDIFAPQDFDEQGFGLMLHQDGHVLEASPSQIHLIGQSLNALPQTLLAGKESTYRNYSGFSSAGPGTLLYAPVKNWPLELAFFLEENMIHGARRQSVGGSHYWLFALLIGVVSSTVFLYFNIRKMLTVDKQLRLSQEKLLRAQYLAGTGDFTWDIDSGNVEWSQGVYRLLGYPLSEVITLERVVQEIHHPDDNELVMQWLNAGIGAKKTDLGSLEYRLLSRSGEIIYVQTNVHIHYDNEQPKSVFGTILNISDLKQVEHQLIYQALHDALTDLPNRTLLMDRLKLAIKRIHQSSTYHFAVLFLDLDDFKIVNDSLGHLTGDQLLLDIAQKLQNIIRPTDLAARLGGDEFVVLLEHIPSVQTAIQTADRILTKLSETTLIDGNPLFITTSIGIVWGTNTYLEASDLLRDADIALYRAKARGRGHYEVFDSEMHVQAVKRMTIERDLRIAIAQQEFVLHYQPIVDLSTRRLIGFESLIRWQHPTRGFISPSDFIPVAEETGLIVPISRWILATACEQVAIWQRQFPDTEDLRISVNLSIQDLRQPSLVQILQQTLQESQLSTNSLTLEITESMLIEDIEATITLLSQLRDLGIHISIDDFGTGYSSLSYLYNLPANYLKIDQSFVGNMQMGNKNYKIVQAIVDLSDQLELAAIAEGIETLQQLEWLRAMNCELGQGYLLSRPLAPQDARALLQAGRTVDYPSPDRG